MKMLYSIIFAYSHYLTTQGYNTPEEIATMSFSQIQDRFFEAKINEEIATESGAYDFDDY